MHVCACVNKSCQTNQNFTASDTTYRSHQHTPPSTQLYLPLLRGWRQNTQEIRARTSYGKPHFTSNPTDVLLLSPNYIFNSSANLTAAWTVPIFTWRLHRWEYDANTSFKDFGLDLMCRRKWKQWEIFSANVCAFSPSALLKTKELQTLATEYFLVEVTQKFPLSLCSFPALAFRWMVTGSVWLGNSHPEYKKWQAVTCVMATSVFGTRRAVKWWPLSCWPGRGQIPQTCVWTRIKTGSIYLITPFLLVKQQVEAATLICR